MDADKFRALAVSMISSQLMWPLESRWSASIFMAVEVLQGISDLSLAQVPRVSHDETRATQDAGKNTAPWCLYLVVKTPCPPKPTMMPCG